MVILAYTEPDGYCIFGIEAGVGDGVAGRRKWLCGGVKEFLVAVY
jgi:hypothetical protein